jgi:phage regulator Rha-like protein
MFQLTDAEWKNLRSQIVIFNKNTRKYKPFAFTEQGVSMLSSVINSERAIEVNINIMRAFVKLRYYVLAKSDTSEQIAELRKLLMVYIENTDYKLSKHDKTIEQIIIALNNLIEKPPKTKTIGFNAEN